MLKNRIIVIFVIVLICNVFLLADQNIPKNWPWKGMSYSVELLEKDPKFLLKLKEIGGNFVRLHIHLVKDVKDTGEKPKVLLQKYYHVIDQALDICKDLNLTASISLSSFPKYDNPHCYRRHSLAFWNDSNCQKNMMDIIRETMLHFKNRGNELSGFDFESEPSVGSWKNRSLPKKWGKRLNEIVDLRDKIIPNKFIIASVSTMGFPENYALNNPLAGRTKIIYNLHMYQPMKYTHQGIGKNSIGVDYPGFIRFTKWDKKKLIQTLKPVRDFQKQNNALILVGEFSAVLWAKNRITYLQDLINIFNQYHWGWSYWGHVLYRGWHPDYQAKRKNSFKYFGKESETWKLLKKNYMKKGN